MSTRADWARYVADHMFRGDDLPADPVRAAVEAMAKPPHVPFSSEYTVMDDTRARCTAKREREEAARERAAVTAALLSDITAGLLVLRTRDHMEISDRHITERANNIVAALVGNYEIKERP